MANTDSQESGKKRNDFDVITDWATFWSADNLTKVFSRVFRTLWPKAYNALVSATDSKTSRGVLQGSLLLLFQGMENLLEKIIPSRFAKYTDIMVDFMAKLPTSILSALTSESQPTDQKIEPADRQQISHALSSAGNLVLFLLQLDPKQWQGWLESLEAIDQSQREKIAEVFSRLQPKQIEKIAKKFSSQKKDESVDWGIFFSIVDSLSSAAENSNKGNKAMSQEEKIANFRRRIIMMDEGVKKDLVGFTEYICATVSKDTYHEIVANLSDWEDDELSTFVSEFKTDEERLRFFDARAHGESHFSEHWSRLGDKAINATKDAIHEIRAYLQRRDTDDKTTANRIFDAAAQNCDRTIHSKKMAGVIKTFKSQEAGG